MHKYKYIFVLSLILLGCEQKKDKKTIYDRMIETVEKQEWYAASKLLNLNINMKNSSKLHLLNGFVYAKLAQQDPSFSGLSVVAYRKALNMDPNNCLASLSIGKHYANEHSHDKAMVAFAKALSIDSQNTEALYGLANAAYATRNITLAKNCIERLLKLCDSAHELTYRLAALIYAACNDPKASYFAKKYSSLCGDKSNVAYLNSRLMSWKKTHARLAKNNYQLRSEEQEQKKEIKSLNLEFIILSFDEKGLFEKGNNFLDTLQEFKKDEFAKGLSIKFGSLPDSQVMTRPVFSRQISKSYDYTNNSWVLDPQETSKVVTKGFAISFDAIRYSLKIAESGSQQTDIIARPNIKISVDGGSGSFYSGDKNFVNTGGDVGSAISNFPSGVKIEVDSSKLENGHVELECLIDVNQMFASNDAGSLNDSATSIFATLKSKIKAKLNSTIVMGGIHSNVVNKSHKGLPILKDVPVFDLVLAKQQENTCKKSVMILLTVTGDDAQKEVMTDILNTENLLLLREHDPELFKREYRHEASIKQQKHEYRVDDFICNYDHTRDEILMFAKKI
ncbi:MAG: tetratricopeptide repeat protein [Alphaproteobacteria bacterium]|nr:MAG: tetratricopeptide repeat protein [Alphaproteobacteria bacterium]